eukprot:scaffold34945_cov80-Phaeocystis_antarctica.AAC.1
MPNAAAGFGFTATVRVRVRVRGRARGWVRGPLLTCSTRLRYVSARVSTAPSGRTYAASLSPSIADALMPPSVGSRISSLPRAPKREHSPSWMGSGSPMSPNIVLNGTPASLSVFAVATSDASLKSTPTIRQRPLLKVLAA